MVDATGDSNLPNNRYIVIDDSQAELNVLNTSLETERIQVVNCTWHRGLTFEKNLDNVGTMIMKDVSIINNNNINVVPAPGCGRPARNTNTRTNRISRLNNNNRPITANSNVRTRLNRTAQRALNSVLSNIITKQEERERELKVLFCEPDFKKNIIFIKDENLKWIVDISTINWDNNWVSECYCGTSNCENKDKNYPGLCEKGLNLSKVK
ncbi:unnamed protein product [Ambrosiozyma monospora]|uniref:Unnamed protein product n=1 Tax=Ambrosiozyma monospora TaxID=43982 RepID=A0A9W6TCP3_AMBMO|nr:unnamed protein product [Ambrosiozyma monospora]